MTPNDIGDKLYYSVCETINALITLRVPYESPAGKLLRDLARVADKYRRSKTDKDNGARQGN